MSFVNQSWSTILRALSLVGKAALVFMLANKLDVEEYGVFGIVVSTAGFAIYLLGFEFYTHTVRSMIGDEGAKEEYIRNHLIFLLLSYMFWLPCVYVVFLLNIIPVGLAVMFYLLLVFEHLSTEIYRLLIALKRPISASFSFFVRNGSWAYVLMVVILYDIIELDLNTVLMYWVAASGLSILFGCARLELQWGDIFKGRVNWRWIRLGAVVGAGFLVGTIFMRASGIVDRYLIQLFMGNYYVGIYMLYISIAGLASSFFESGVLMHAFPDILEAKKLGNAALFRSRLRNLFVQSIYVSLILVVGAYAVFQLTLYFSVLPSDYGKETVCFLVVLLGVFVKNLSFTPHYGLYASGMDSKILYSSIIGFLVGVVLCIYLIPSLGITGAAIAMLIANLVILAVKSTYYVVYKECSPR